MGARRVKGRESDVIQAIRQGLSVLGVPNFRLNSGAFVVSMPGQSRRFFRAAFVGAPDLFALLPNGHTLWIEAKAEGGKLSEAQEQFRDLCRKHNIPWVLARSWDDVAPYVRPS